MIRSLYIQNYALIEQLEITFEDGFSVITGETGAGKSIMLGALALLLGQRADSKAIRQGASKCVIEAHFDLANAPFQQFFLDNALDFDVDCILRREVYASGKSRAFINDIPVQLSQMKALGDQLIDIHSQHQNLLLNHESFQLDVLDILAHHQEDLLKYRQLFKEWTDTKKNLQQVKEEVERNKVDEDYVRFQLDQLQEAHLQIDEQERLEQEAEMLSHAEDIKSALFTSAQLLDGEGKGVLQMLKECCSSLQHIANFYPAGAVLTERLDSSYIELKDIADELANQEEDVEFNPVRLDEITDRLNTIYTLQKKHRVDSVVQLLDIEADFQRRLDNITSSDDKIAVLQQHCDRCKLDLLKLAGMLTKKRVEAAKLMEDYMREKLVPLGMPHVRFQVKIVPRQELDINGMDSVSFLFSANKNGTLQDISAVASGGEIARVMLSLKAMLAGEALFSTIIFDEIDTGVSGEIAARMAAMMENMALGFGNEQRGGRQVISITHLPQIAAKGKAHYKVYKEDNEHETVSQIRRLTPEERVEEIAHMLSGDTLSEAAIQNARELLKVRS
jgi:DNA repair protein RecN (Recombination protein N)